MLYIYDLVKKKYIYRFPFYGYGTRTPPGVYWSPDGNYIVPFIPEWHMPLEILNLRTGQMYELVKDASRVSGWSDKFPVVWP